MSVERRVGRGRDLWIIIVAAAVFSLIAMWSMPGFPAVGPGDLRPRQRLNSPPRSATPALTVVATPRGLDDLSSRLAPWLAAPSVCGLSIAYAIEV